MCLVNASYYVLISRCAVILAARDSVWLAETQVKVPTWVNGAANEEYVGVGDRLGPTLESKEKHANHTRLVIANPSNCCSTPKNKTLCKQNTNNNSKRKWKHRKGKLRFSLVKAQLDHLKSLVDNDGKSHDEAFHEIFGEEKLGRVRCGGRTLTPSLLKKNQEMAAMTKMHAMEMASIKEDMEKKLEKKLEERDRDMERKLEETQKYFKSMLKSVLTQMNPSLDVNAIDAMMPPTPTVANSGFNSSTAMHIPNIEDNDDIHEGDDIDDDDDDDDEIDLGDTDGDEMDHE
ncbi:hypothetical protein ACFE04_000809 [Oxalis oulophora]